MGRKRKTRQTLFEITDKRQTKKALQWGAEDFWENIIPITLGIVISLAAIETAHTVLRFFRVLP